jgi:DNA-binding Lrp family transcriptional regulator
MKDQTNPPDGVRTTDEFLAENSYQCIPSVLLNDVRRGKLRRDDIDIWCLLKSRARFKNKGECWPTYEWLAQMANCHEDTIWRSLRRLESAGHIQRKNEVYGHIFLLTDVSKGGKIIRRERTISLPKARKVKSPKVKPPKVIEPIREVVKSLDDELPDSIDPFA